MKIVTQELCGYQFSRETSPGKNMGLQIVYRSLYSNPRADEVKLASFIGKNMSAVEWKTPKSNYKSVFIYLVIFANFAIKKPIVSKLGVNISPSSLQGSNRCTNNLSSSERPQLARPGPPIWGVCGEKHDQISKKKKKQKKNINRKISEVEVVIHFRVEAIMHFLFVFNTRSFFFSFWRPRDNIPYPINTNIRDCWPAVQVANKEKTLGPRLLALHFPVVLWYKWSRQAHHLSLTNLLPAKTIKVKWLGF